MVGFWFSPASAVFVLVLFNNAFYWDLAPRIRAFFARPSNPIEWLRATPPSAVAARGGRMVRQGRSSDIPAFGPSLTRTSWRACPGPSAPREKLSRGARLNRQILLAPTMTRMTPPTNAAPPNRGEIGTVF